MPEIGYKFSGLIVDDFIDADLCAFLVSLLPSINWQDNDKNGYWSNRTSSPWNIAEQVLCSTDIELIFNIIASKINNIFKSYFGKYDLHPDTLDVVRWMPGLSQSPHADAYMNNGEPNEFSYRMYGAIIYLNESFNGGVTYYPTIGKEIKPKIGRLAIHPADLHHLHGVTKVEDGVRYTIASFWTNNQNHKIGINHQMDSKWT